MYSFHFPPSGFPVYIGYQKIVNEKISVCKQIMIVYRNSMKITLGQGGHIVVVQCPPNWWLRHHKPNTGENAGFASLGRYATVPLDPTRNKSLICTPRHDLVKARKCLQTRSGFVNIFSNCLDKVSFSCNKGFAEGGQGSSGKRSKSSPLGETIIA